LQLPRQAGPPGGMAERAGLSVPARSITVPPVFAHIIEARPSIRWHIGRICSKSIYRYGFGAWGPGSTLVRPLRLRGVKRIFVGANCAIYEDAWLECGPGGRLDIGDRAYLGHRCHLHALGQVIIGPDCMFADDVLVSDGRHDFDGTWPGVEAGNIEIGARVWLGQRVCVLPGVTIGEGAVVGAGSVVTHDVAPGELVAGVPARPLGIPKI